MNKLCSTHLILSLLFLILKPYVCNNNNNNNNNNLFLIRGKLTCEYDQMRLYVDWTGEHYAGAKLSHADLVSGALHMG